MSTPSIAYRLSTLHRESFILHRELSTFHKRVVHTPLRAIYTPPRVVYASQEDCLHSSAPLPTGHIYIYR
jgi:hypothetical protein